MPFSELMVAPMRKELARLGVRELRTAEEVDAFMQERPATSMVIVNSTCGCAAGSMRPAVAAALRHASQPDALATVFAGQDAEATARAREYFVGYAPSSPSIALFRDDDLVFMLERHEIQGRHPDEIAARLTAAFDAHCSGQLKSAGS